MKGEYAKIEDKDVHYKGAYHIVAVIFFAFSIIAVCFS
jgi:hypothetical protein